MFIQHGVQQLVCAAPDQGDLSEDEVADRLVGVLSAGLVAQAQLQAVNFKTEAAVSLGMIVTNQSLNSVDNLLR